MYVPAVDICLNKIKGKIVQVHKQYSNLHETQLVTSLLGDIIFGQLIHLLSQKVYSDWKC